ncbi:hypothetical protein HDU87_007065 [Geranomyces variabilis]|uniref:Uncharacterized protein n=1 Tax=Geranomyces variabilis TaxID=109894 RepID=A0AAD5TEH0_9FUNG|nr:hypothetical protein HDU87_007065 [Geranomyces variabilis]
MPDVMPPLASGFGALASFSGLPSVAQIPSCENVIETEGAKRELLAQEEEAQDDVKEDDRASSAIDMPETKDDFVEDDTKTTHISALLTRENSPLTSAAEAGTAKRERLPDDSDSESGRRVKLKPFPDSASADRDYSRRVTPKPPPDSPSAGTFITADSKDSLPAAANTSTSPSATTQMDPRNLNVFFPNYLALAQHHLMVHSQPGNPPEAVPPPPPESLLARLAAAIMVGDYHTAGVLEFQAASLVAAMAAVKAEGGTALEDVPSAAAKVASLSTAAMTALVPPTQRVAPMDLVTGRVVAKEEHGSVMSVPYVRGALISVSSSEDESCCDDEDCKCEMLPPADSVGSNRPHSSTPTTPNMDCSPTAILVHQT